MLRALLCAAAIAPVSGNLLSGESVLAGVPANLERLDPAVSDLIRRQLSEIETRGENPETVGTLCLVYEANLLWDAARDCLALVAEWAPGDYLWRFHLAIAIRESGNVEEAALVMQQLARQFPDFAPLQQRLGEALLESGEVAQAQTAYRRVIELAPAAAEGYAGLGDALLSEQAYAAAVETLEQAVRRDPGFREARYLLGVAYRGVGRNADAMREMSIGMDASPRYLTDPLTARLGQYRVSSTARIEQGVALLAASRPAEAAAVFERALGFDPDNHTLLNNLAAALMQQGQLERSYQLLQRALERDDQKFSTYLNLSSWALRNRQLEQALAYADAAIVRAGDLYQTHMARARVLVYLGRDEEAIVSLQNAVRFNSRSPQPMTVLGDQLARLGRFGPAEQNYRDALSVAPDFLPAYLGLTRVYLDQGRLDLAAVAVESARGIAPDHPAVAALAEQVKAGQ